MTRRTSREPARDRARSDARDSRRAVQREALLDAAVQVIRRDGPRPSMSAIATEAGITKPILYRHFGDRAGLVVALGTRFAEELLGVLGEALAQDDADSRALFTGTVDAYLAFVERDPHLYRFVVQPPSGANENSDNPALLEDYQRQIARQIAVVIGERLREDGRDSGGAEVMAHGIVGLVHAAGDWWLDRQTMPRARLVQYLTDLLWDGLAGAPEPGTTESQNETPSVVPLHRRTAR